MSKSLGNYIGIDEAPDTIFGKVMSISDETMWVYFELISFRPMAEILQFQQEVRQGLNPRDVKFLLAEEIVERFHYREAAVQAREHFIAQFQRGAIPENIPEVHFQLDQNGMRLANIIKDAALTPSTSDAIRMIEQGAVKIDGQKIEDTHCILKPEKTVVLQVGKRRFAKIILKQK
jgi:tyrosyl-tRNA synthetase